MDETNNRGLAAKTDESNEQFQALNSDKAETSIEEQLRLLFDSETIETYKQLSTLTTAKETSQVGTSEILENEDIVAIEPKPATYIEIAPVPDFETFLAVQPKSSTSCTKVCSSGCSLACS